MGLNSIRLNSCIKPGKKNLTAIRLDLEAAVRLALESEARANQTEVRLNQVDQSTNQVKVTSTQVDQSANEVEEGSGQGVESAGCPNHARRRGAACLANLWRSEAA